MAMMDLPTWANTLITAAITALVAGIVGFIVERGLKRHFDQQEKNEKALHDQRRAERKREIGEVVNEAIKPINERLDEVDRKIDKIQEDLNLDREGTIVQMRVMMMDLHKKYMRQGYADCHEKATWNEMYERYKLMGGNHFKEYIDLYKDDIESLPSEKRKKASKKAD